MRTMSSSISNGLVTESSAPTLRATTFATVSPRAVSRRMGGLIPLIGTDLARAGRGIVCPRETETRGGIHRRLLLGSEKGGLAIGPTRPGKGMKIVAVLPMIIVFLSPLVWKVLRRMKANSSKGPRAQLPRPLPRTIDRRQGVR